MQKYFNSVQNRHGAAVAGAAITVTTLLGVAAILYSDNGVTVRSAPLTADANGYFEFYAVDGRYNIGISGPTITPITIADILLEDPAEGAGAGTAFLTLPSGGGFVGFSQAETYLAGTLGAKCRQRISVKDAPYNATGDGVTNDTASIQAAIDAVYAAGGGTVYFPSGTYKVSSVVKNWAASITVNLLGDGQRCTILQKITGTTTPVLDLSADAGVLETYSNLKGFRIRGDAKANHGIRLTRNARFVLDDVRIDTCDTAIDNNGALVFSAYDLCLQSNNTGYKSRKSGTIYANLVRFFGGNISANATFGMDIGDASGVHVYGTDISANGTALDLATGAVVIRSTAADESGVSAISFSGVWLEANKGMCIRSEAANLSLAFRDVLLLGSEGGNAMDIGDIRTLILENVMAASVGDTITVAAKNLIVNGGNITTLADNSTQSSIQSGVGLSTGTTKFRARELNARIGTSTAFAPAPAAVSKQMVAVGNLGAGEDDLLTYTLPANALSAAGKGVRITAWGTTANNANAKTLKIYFGGTQIGTISLTVSQANAWRVDGEVLFRGTTLYTSIMQTAQGGTVTKADCIATTLSGPDPTGTLVIKCTGEAVADSDILHRGLVVEFLN